MIPRDDPLPRQLGARHRADDVPDAAQAVVLAQAHPHFHRTGTEVIGERQSPLPVARRDRSLQLLEDRCGIAVGERCRRYRGKILRLVGRNPLRLRQVGNRCHARRGGISRIAIHQLDRAALRRCFRPIAPLGIGIALKISVVHRIGVNDHPGRAVFLRQRSLHAAEDFAITHQHDSALDADAHLRQLLVILRTSVVGVDDLALHVPRRRTAHERNHQARVVLVRISLDALAVRSGQSWPLRGQHLDAYLDRVVEPHLVFVDARLQTGFAELRGDILGGLAVLLATGYVRRRTERHQVPLGKLRAGDGQEFFFQLKLPRRIAESADGRRCARAGLAACANSAAGASASRSDPVSRKGRRLRRTRLNRSGVDSASSWRLDSHARPPRQTRRLRGVIGWNTTDPLSLHELSAALNSSGGRGTEGGANVGLFGLLIVGWGSSTDAAPWRPRPAKPGSGRVQHGAAR